MQKSQGYGGLFTLIGNLNEDQLNDAIYSIKGKSIQENVNAKSILQLVKIAGRHIFGSPSERIQNRQTSKGILMALGMESCMVTVNFDDIR